jgi:GntR family transcriptional regulator, galactonate operon transcriptional repressor
VRTLVAADGTRYRRPGRLAEIVVDDLAREIIAGSHPENEVLPHEPALCDQFGMSRTVVREALKMLEERGLVRIEQGRGTTVQPRTSWNLLDPVILGIALQYDNDMSLLDDLINVRRVLEQEMTRAATSRLTEDELEALAENIDQMEASCDDYDRFRAFDLAFHRVIMEASENRVGLTIVRAIHRYGGVRPQLSTAATRVSLERTTAEHRAIYEALLGRDADLAGERTAAHIESAWAERKDSKPGP